MTPDEQKEIDRQSRLAGQRIIEEQARQEVRTFLDLLRNGARLYQTVTRLGEEVTKEYRGRAVMELLQNAYDVLGLAGDDDPRRISFVLNSSPVQPELLVANSGRPFHPKDLNGICQLAQSTKRLNKSVGNKGLGFRSVYELTTRPEVWSTAPAGGDVAFAFGFDPDVLGAIARVAKRLFDRDAPTDPAFGPEPVVDWSDNQIDEYRARLSEKGKTVEEVKEWLSGEIKEYLSPYGLPRFLGDPPLQVARLLDDGHVTVIRLPLDGGKTGDSARAITSVGEQLKALDAAAIAFLHELSALSISIDGESVERIRSVDPDLPFPAPSLRRDRVRVRKTATDASDGAERSFQVWSRTVGGADQPETSERIAEGVRRHLPDRRHEVRTVEVAVAVEETNTAPPEGLYFISLPTETHTTVGAHINAPFYGSLDRRHIYFEDGYNKLLLEFVKKLMRDVVEGLVAGDRESWLGRSVIDLFAPVPDSPDGNSDSREAKKKGPRLTGTLRELRFANERPLVDQALILCDDGWCQASIARTMPEIPAEDPFGKEEWRRQAGFHVVSCGLEGRREAVEALLQELGGSPRPRNEEWARTLALMAEQVRRRQADREADRSRPTEASPGWNKFLSSVLAVLPPKLRSEPKDPDADSLAKARFLPTEDGELRSASDAAPGNSQPEGGVRIFFQPRRGADDAADFVASVPVSLQHRIAFLHHDVQTHEGPQRRRTEVQKFLDGRFVQSFRREDLLREVIIPSLPELPARHREPEATVCADALAWTLEVIGEDEPEGLLPLLGRLPVACTGGWFAMKEAVFGPGWAGRSGEHLVALADGLTREEGEKLLRNALLPPGDDRWFPQGEELSRVFGDPRGIGLANRGDLFARAGVVDGLRLHACDPIRFEMCRAHPKLPGKSPVGFPQAAWNDWKEAVREEVRPKHSGWFKYDLRDVNALALLHRSDLGDSARTALSNLILASLRHWDEDWDKVTISKVKGEFFAQQITSPLKHWLSTMPWLVDTPSGDQGPLRYPRPLHQRWFVPGSLLRVQIGRFRHLSPLSMPLAQRLGEDEEQLEALVRLGLNVYPTEDDRTGPALLEALADVARTVVDGAGLTARHKMPAGGFDVLLGQIRHGWRHFDPDPKSRLPRRFIIRTKPRTLTVRTADELKGVYLPDHGWKTRLLREHGQPIVAMRPEEASKKPLRDRLVEVGARRAAGLEERCRIDHGPSAQALNGTQTLDAAGLGWLPVVLLALHAHGGGNPAGPATKAWGEAADRLRRARVRQCSSITVDLVDAGRSVAQSEPRAHWLPQDRILVLHRGILQTGLYEEIAAASQAVLDRQDLLKDLRLVLGALQGRRQPTRAEIEAALDRAEIDAVAVANIRHLWGVGTSTLIRRIRPVLQLLGVSHDDLDGAAKDTSSLTKWLKKADITKWPAEELLATARECYDHIEMGYRTRQVLGDAYDLKEWNAALEALDGKYEQVSNTQAEAQATRYLYEAAPLLRAFAKHVATMDVPVEDQGKVFVRLNAVHQNLAKAPEWPRRYEKWSEEYWKVPFAEVLEVLRAGYKDIPEANRHLCVVEGVTSINELRSALERREVALEPDPLEVARDNRYRLDRAVREVRQLYEAWLAKKGAAAERGTETAEARLDESMYLREWPGDDLMERAKRAVDDSDFHAAVKGCETIKAMREKLVITPPDGNGERRQPITREVAGVIEPVDGTDDNYRNIFKRLKELPKLPREGGGIGPPSAGPDGDIGASPRYNGEAGKRGSKTAPLRPSPHLPEFVGIIGEMQAFRFLKAKFGIDESAWVSEFRNRVVPLLDGENDETSDGHGYDFRFTHGDVTWCVEVKATTGDGTSFDLPSSELNAASRIAPRKEERWRVLRVRRALDERPECDWLPNPFEQGGDERLRLRQGGVTVEYTLSEATADPEATSPAAPSA